MSKVIVSYSFLYYALYQYCRKIWGFSKDWPEFYAALILSIFLCFLLGGTAFLSIALLNFDFLGAVADSEGLKWMPEIFRGIWYYLLIVFLNVYYFVMKKKWEGCIELYDKYPAEVVRKNYWLSALLLVLIVAFYLGTAFFLEGVREAS